MDIRDKLLHNTLQGMMMEMWIVIIVELIIGALVGAMGYMLRVQFEEIKTNIRELRNDFKDDIKEIKDNIYEHEQRINQVTTEVIKIKYAHKKHHNEEI